MREMQCIVATGMFIVGAGDTEIIIVLCGNDCDWRKLKYLVLQNETYIASSNTFATNESSNTRACLLACMGSYLVICIYMKTTSPMSCGIYHK